jgi:hypothetical protein
MKIRIVTTGYREIGPESIDATTGQLLREAMAGDKWQVADVTEDWRSDVETTDSVTVYDDDGSMLWAGTF